MAARVYITGAAGSGTSTLGRALASHFGVKHLDTDDYFWAPSDPPYTTQRPVEERIALIAAEQLAEGPQGGWVLSGAADGWGDTVIDGAHLIVLLRAPMPVRIARIRRREQSKFGLRVKPGGDMYASHTEFLKWASAYDDPYFRGRSLARHMEWLSDRKERVLQLSGLDPVADLVQHCLDALNQGSLPVRP